MRFDYRGMGDTGGEARAFSSVDDDIRAAVDTFHETVGGLDGIVLWGLCDGASAACFYAPRDPRVTAAVLLNPWVRTEATAAKVYIEKYYARRFLQPAFWKKLLGGGVAIGKSLRELLSAVRTASKGRSRTSATLPLPQRMASDLGEARRPLLVILSGKDFVANEFEQVAATDARWSHLLANATVAKLEAADHTFSTAAWRDHVARTTGDWVIALAGNGSQRSHSRS
jgi:exosortase A-associated hydrolase 1